MSSQSLINFESFFKVTYGLYIVSSMKDNKLNGFISNTVFQVTAEPEQFAICCNKNNLTAELITASQVFSISILQQDTDSKLIGLFGYKSGKDVNKFENISYITGSTNVPIVTEESIAWFECKVVQTLDVGTHMVYIGKVVNSDILNDTKEPLTYDYYRKVKKGKAPKNAPTYIDAGKLKQKVTDKVPLSKYECQVCGYVYDPEIGDEKGSITVGTAFENLPDGWVCPICGTIKSDFEKI